MSVPNTNTFSEQDVKDEIGSGSSLVELFTLSSNIGFDGIYKGDKDRLTNFRNYTHIYLNINNTSLHFDSNGDPWSTRRITVSSNLEWYIIFDQSQIISAYVEQTSGSNNGYVDFYCGESNTSGDIHTSYVKFYRTSDNTLLAECYIVQHP
ncbi:MAG: hypothetical protein LLG13_12895 [Bacteroidales bacterium]|nr:hypothetical protein [Bacteroidales bacterium]